MMINWELNSAFWPFIDRRRNDQCWHWKAGKQSAGYGVFYYKGKQMLAHRAACASAWGDPPDDKPFALHSCDNRSCCNPRHLRWGTQKDNVNDALERKRHSAPPKNYPGRNTGKMPKGEQVWNSELSETTVRRIWRMHLSGANSRVIAETIGVSRNTVVDLNRGRTWRHLTDAPSIETLKSGGVRRGHNQFSASSNRSASTG